MEGYIMDSIKVTYELARHDTPNFHGWIIWECSEGMEAAIYHSTSLEDARAVLQPQQLQGSILRNMWHRISLFVQSGYKYTK